MPVDTSEKDFEASIEEYLLENGYVSRRPEQYDRNLCLDPEMLIQFIISTQPRTWEKLKDQRGEQVKERFLERVIKEIQARGTLDVLRRGVIDLGCKFDLAYYRPASALNPEHQRKYEANIFSVVRQLKYSIKNENSIDLAIMLNGIPILTAELKNPLKGQTVKDAIKQYQRDRDPREPLLALLRCLVHFSVDPDLVFMATTLKGSKTTFHPFNLGNDNTAGNPDNSEGYKTCYLWEDIWSQNCLLDLIDHFLYPVEDRDEYGNSTGKKTLLFPRFHQLDAVNRLVESARISGSGHSYLIEHSAGSGKSNTIAWLAHRLVGLHNELDHRIFDSVIVISDRRVIDSQLQEVVRSFEQVKGVVETIDKSKTSKDLLKALEENRDIIVTTLQKFPIISKRVAELPGKRFAVIIDEAHSSQTGEAAREMKGVLAVSSFEEAEKLDAEEPDDQDTINQVIEAEMKKSGRLNNVSFFAFTATPKSKTLELFGELQSDGTFKPFSTYSMRQAIEEKYILDVLDNYTTFGVFFELEKRGEEDPEYAREKAAYLAVSYASGEPHMISKKTEIMADHFHEHVSKRIGGQAKAMVVTRSRLHAVRYKQELDRHLKAKGYPYKALVAFTGTVRDKGIEYTEANMNGFPESKTAKRFKGNDFRFLVVAEKFQTGFDQPLLHTMYVDKKLAGVHAVQTLSRLNRKYPDKDDTFVLDFVNDADDIRNSFQPFFQTTILSEATDPNKLYDLMRMAGDHLVYSAEEVDAFAREYFSQGGRQERLHAILDPAIARFKELPIEKQEEFRKQMKDYARLYSFLSHILAFTDVQLEKFYQFARFLVRKLPDIPGELPIEVLDKINMASLRIQIRSDGSISLLGEDGTLKPISELGTGRPKEEDKAPLSEILTYVNEHYGTEFSSEDRIKHFSDDMERRLAAIEGLRRAFNLEVNPSEEDRRLAFRRFYEDTLEDMIDSNFDIYKKIKDDPDFGELFQTVMFRRIGETYGEATV